MKKIFFILFCVATSVHAQTNYNFQHLTTMDASVLFAPQTNGSVIEMGGAFTGKIATISNGGISQSSGITQNVLCLADYPNGSQVAGTDQNQVWLQNNGVWTFQSTLCEKPKFAITTGNNDALFIEEGANLPGVLHPVEHYNNGNITSVGNLPGIPQQACRMGNLVYIGCLDLLANQNGLWVYDILTQTLTPATNLPTVFSKISSVTCHGDTLYCSGIDGNAGDRKLWRCINGVWEELLNITQEWWGGSEVTYMAYNSYNGEVHMTGTATNAYYSEKSNDFHFYNTPAGKLRWITFLPNGDAIGTNGLIIYATFTSTGLDEPGESEGGIKIYPNPARNYITVEGVKTPPTITNMLGETLQVPFTRAGNNFTYNISTLSSGLYHFDRTPILKE